MKDERYLQILDFLGGKLTEDETQAFRNAIAADEQLAEDVAFVRLEREMMDTLLDDDLSRKMQDWQQEKNALPDEPDNDIPPGNGSPGKNNGRRFWLLLLLPLLAAGVWWFSNPLESGVQTKIPATEVQTGTPGTPEAPPENVPPATDQPETAPSENTEPPNPDARKPSARQSTPIAQNGTPSNEQLIALVEENDFVPADYFPHSTRGAADDLAKAEKARRAGNFDEAILLYEKVSGQNSGPGVEAAWNLALLYFDQKSYEKALPWFEQTAKNQNFLFGQEAQYHLALCNLALRRFDRAHSLLDDLIQIEYFENPDHLAKARQLRKQLAEWR